MPGFHLETALLQIAADPGEFILVRMISPQIDDHFDANRFQFGHALGRRLRATIQIRGDLMEIGQARFR